MKYLTLFLLLFLISCDSKSNLTPEEIRTGTFKTFLDDSDINSIATRNDSIQIETFNQKKDTFRIKWKSNFEYSLFKKNPQTAIDSSEFVIKITGISKNSYTFRAYYKGSNFKQTGKAIRQK